MPAHIPRTVSCLWCQLFKLQMHSENHGRALFRSWNSNSSHLKQAVRGALRTCINADRQAHVGWDASTCTVEGELGDGNAHCLNPQVPQSSHPLSICQADGLDPPLWPVFKKRVHPSCRCRNLSSAQIWLTFANCCTSVSVLAALAIP